MKKKIFVSGFAYTTALVSVNTILLGCNWWSKKDSTKDPVEESKDKAKELNLSANNKAQESKRLREESEADAQKAAEERRKVTDIQKAYDKILDFVKANCTWLLDDKSREDAAKSILEHKSDFITRAAVLEGAEIIKDNQVEFLDHMLDRTKLQSSLDAIKNQ